MEQYIGKSRKKKRKNSIYNIENNKILPYRFVIQCLHVFRDFSYSVITWGLIDEPKLLCVDIQCAKNIIFRLQIPIYLGWNNLANKKTKIFGWTFLGKHKYKYIPIQSYRKFEYYFFYNENKSNTNTNIRTDICKYKCK